MITQNQEKLLQTLFQNLLHFDYQSVIAYIGSLDPADQKAVTIFIEDPEFLSLIAWRKIFLADIILKEANVEAMDEDRIRVVFLLAKLVSSTFKAAEQAFKSEFGDHFVLKETYIVNSRPHSWKELAIKAKQVKNAYRNLDLLMAREVVAEILSYYYSFSEQDPKKLRATIDLADILLAAIQKRSLDPGSEGEEDEIRKRLLQFLKLSGWLDIEIEKLKASKEFEPYANFIQSIMFVCIARLYLINNKLPIDNTAPAETILLKYFANEVAFLYRKDSMVRQHLKLPAVKH